MSNPPTRIPIWLVLRAKCQLLRLLYFVSSNPDPTLTSDPEQNFSHITHQGGESLAAALERLNTNIQKSVIMEVRPCTALCVGGTTW